MKDLLGNEAGENQTDQNNAPDEKKKKNRFCKRLHSNEEILQELSKGYLFHSGDGKVKYRTFDAVEKYEDENELHAEQVQTMPERRQQTGR